MQIDPIPFLDIAEKAGEVCFFDIECTGTKADYNSVLVVTVKPFGGKPVTLSVDRPGDDRQLVRAAKRELDKYHIWVSFYGKGFDVPMLNGRRSVHGNGPLSKRHHLDLYWLARANFVTARRSMAHLSEWLETPRKKLTLSPNLWNTVLYDTKRGLEILRRRCEADCAELEDLYRRVKPFVRDIQR